MVVLLLQWWWRAEWPAWEEDATGLDVQREWEVREKRRIETRGVKKAGVSSPWEVVDPRGRTDILCANGYSSHNGHEHHQQRPGSEFCDVDSGLFFFHLVYRSRCRRGEREWAYRMRQRCDGSPACCAFCRTQKRNPWRRGEWRTFRPRRALQTFRPCE